MLSIILFALFSCLWANTFMLVVNTIAIWYVLRK